MRTYMIDEAYDDERAVVYTTALGSIKGLHLEDVGIFRPTGPARPQADSSTHYAVRGLVFHGVASLYRTFVGDKGETHPEDVSLEGGR